MSPRRIIFFSGRLIRTAIYAVIAGIIVFFALTRTEVGREGLRTEMERQFNRTRNGTLEIGSLTGNLLNRLTARNVVVRDSTGRRVVTVEHVVVHPTWTALLQRTLSTHRLTLIRPEFLLFRDESGSWNLTDSFGGVDTTAEAAPWALQSTRIDIVDGRIRTRSEAPPPDPVAQGRLFDWTNAAFDGIDARALLDWESEMKLIDVLQLSGRFAEPDLDVDSLRGQLVFENGGVAVYEFHLRTPRSAVRMNATISPLSRLRGDPGIVEMSLDLAPSTIDGTEAARFFPHLDFDGGITASARVRGPLQRLVVETVTAQYGSSEIAAEGTIIGLPDSADYDVEIPRGVLHSRDLTAVWPEAPVPTFEQVGRVDVSGYARGVVRFETALARTHWEGHNEFEIASQAGRVALSGQTAWGDSLSMDGVLTFDGLDVGRLLSRTELASNLNGRLQVQASGAALRHASGRATAALTASTWARRSLDTVHVNVTGEPDALEAQLLASSGPGHLTARVQADLASPQPSYHAEGRVSNLDVGTLLLSDSLTSTFNGRFLIDGQGATWTAFQGDVRYDLEPSSVAFGRRSRSVPSHSSRLSIRPQATGAPSVVLQGDVADVSLSGDVALRPLVLYLRHWGSAATRALNEEMAKPYRREFSSTGEPVSVTDRLEGVAMPPHAVVAGLEPLVMDLRAEIHRSDILSSLLPALPSLQTNLTAGGHVHMEADQIDAQIDISADSLHVGRFRSTDLHMDLNGDVRASPSVSHTLHADLSVAVSSLSWGDHMLVDPVLTASYVDRGFDLTVDASIPDVAAPLHLSARMDLLATRNRLVVNALQLPVGDQVWSTPDMHRIDFFEDAVYVRGMRIERHDQSEAEPNFFEVSGTLSSAPEDTLFVRAANLRMEHLTTAIGSERPVGGRLDGRLAYTGFNRRPELTGRVDIEPLTYENRHLGHLRVNSRYIPGSPDVGLHVELTPSEPLDETLVSEVSDLTVDGTFRLPPLDGAAPSGDRGMLDLNVDVRRADAFFFDFIFRDLVADVSGRIDGSGHIGGDFSTPVFDADLTVRDARFRVPEFGLSYDVAGPVTVDDRGIHLEGLDLADPDEGSALVRGSILFNDYRYFSFDLQGDLDETLIMNVQQSRDLPFYGRVAASGTFSLTGPISSAMLQSADVRTTASSDLFIPIAESGSATDAGFIVFADSTGDVPNFERLSQRDNLLARRPAGERPFLDGLGMDLNILAPEGSTVHLVIDPLLGDVINAVGSGRVQLARDEGDFATFGTFNVTSGDYLFTAGEVFFRRFLIDNGTITWDGDPLNAMLDISASYRTRASTDGLGLNQGDHHLIPLVIELGVSGRVASPIVHLALTIDQGEQNFIGGYEGLEALLNEPELAAQYATSVLLTNSFLLTADQPLAQSRGQLAFNSLSQLVASQLNRYINYALPNVNLNLGVQGESTEDLDVTYGVALRMLDERLIIRGQGIYPTDQLRREQENLLDEFVVEVRLNPRVSVEVFYRREGDLFSTESLNTSTTGAGLSYQTEFSTWRRLIDRLFGWLYATDPAELAPEDIEPEDDDRDGEEGDGESDADVVAGTRE